MAVLERLAGDPPASHHAGGLVKPQGCAAVVDRGGAQILQRLSVAYHAEVILVPVLVDDQVVQYDHPVHGLPDAGNIKGFTAVQIMLIDRDMIGPLYRLHDIPRWDQLGFRGDKVLTYAVRVVLLDRQSIGYMWDTQTLHYGTGQHLIVGLLLGGAASALHQASALIQNGPLFLQPTVRGVVRGHQAYPAAG